MPVCFENTGLLIIIFSIVNLFCQDTDACIYTNIVSEREKEKRKKERKRKKTQLRLLE